MALPTRPAVVLTRSPQDNAPLRAALEADGASVVEIPCAGTRFLDPGPLPHAIAAALFPSRRAVEGLCRVPAARALLAGACIGAVGPATARALEQAGIPVDTVADPPEGRVLARQVARLVARLLADRSPTPPMLPVLVARGDHDREQDPLLPWVEAEGLKAHVAVVYENVAPPIPRMDPFPVAAVFVAAPSAAVRLLGALPWLEDAPFFTIGGTTRVAVEKLGVRRVHAMGPDLDTWRRTLMEATKIPHVPRSTT